MQVLVKGVGMKEKSSPKTTGKVDKDVVGEMRMSSGKPRPRPNITFGATIKMKTSCGNLYVTINEDEKGPLEVFARLGKSGGCLASYTEAIGRLVSLALRSGVDPNSIVRQLTGIRCPLPILFGKDRVLSCSDAIGQALKKYLEMRLQHRLQSTEPENIFSKPIPSEKQIEQNSSVKATSSEKKSNSNNSLFFLSKDVVPLNPDNGLIKARKTQKSEEIGSEDAYNGWSPQCPECGAIMEFKEGCATCPVCGYSKCM